MFVWKYYINGDDGDNDDWSAVDMRYCCIVEIDTTNAYKYMI